MDEREKELQELNQKLIETSEGQTTFNKDHLSEDEKDADENK